MTAQDEKALLQDILDNPSDDVIRMIYADWLEENGKERRAEYIRISCHRRSRGCEFCDGTDDNCAGVICRTLGKRQLELLSNNGWIWKQECYPLNSTIWNDPDDEEDEIKVEWDRGFIYKISCDLVCFMRQDAAKILFSHHPIEEVDLVDRGLSSSQHIGWYGRMIYPDETTVQARCPEPDDIPIELWNCLDVYRDEPAGWKWYKSEPDMKLALSKACVKFGREKALEARKDDPR